MDIFRLDFERPRRHRHRKEDDGLSSSQLSEGPNRALAVAQAVASSYGFIQDFFLFKILLREKYRVYIWFIWSHFLWSKDNWKQTSSPDAYFLLSVSTNQVAYTYNCARQTHLRVGISWNCHRYAPARMYCGSSKYNSNISQDLTKILPSLNVGFYKCIVETPAKLKQNLETLKPFVVFTFVFSWHVVTI